MAREVEPLNKPREIEGFLDVVLIRPLGALLVSALKRTRVTPNQVSAASVLAAVACALAYLRADLAGALLGLFFLLATSALDSADGQLARVTGRGSELGRAIDGLCDNLSFGAIYAAFVIAQARRLPAGSGGGLALLVLLALAAALSHSLQSALVDFVRQVYLRIALSGPSLAGERPESIAARRSQARLAGETPLARLLLALHHNYSREQRGVLRSTDRLERAYERALAARPDRQAELALACRQENLGRLRWWTLGASNVHKVGIAACAFVPVLAAPRSLLGQLGLTSYFVYDLALNLPLVALILSQARSDRRLIAAIERMGAQGSGSGQGGLTGSKSE